MTLEKKSRTHWTRMVTAALALMLVQSWGAVGESESNGQDVRLAMIEGQQQAPLFPMQEAATSQLPVSSSKAPSPFPTGKVFQPKRLFASRSKLDKQVMEANPQVYLHEQFDASLKPIIVVGMPGWGGRSENFIWLLVNSLNKQLKRRVVVTSIQDLHTGGPRYQGQGDRAHANIWPAGRGPLKAMHHFLSALSNKLQHPEVYLMGFSTGGTSAPLFATRLADIIPSESYTIKGGIALGTQSNIRADLLKEHNQRALFIVAPEKLRSDPKPMRDDQWNRISAERRFEQLKAEGAPVYLRHVATAKRHVDWHWGLVSQCRYFRTSRIDAGRGYWPSYATPNPETAAHLVAFLQGEEPPAESANPPTQNCPY